MAFRSYLIQEDFNEFNTVLDRLIEDLQNKGSLNENFISSLSDKLKSGIEFIKKLASDIGIDLIELLKAFKEKALFVFFTSIKWSTKKLLQIVKDGYKLYTQLMDDVAKFVADSDIVKFSHANLGKLDEFLKSHPYVQKAGGLVIAGMLIYIWANMMSFTGDIDFDFDMSTIGAALAGHYLLADLFASKDGVKMLMFMVTSTLKNLSFPWPGSTILLFSFAVIYTVTKHKYPDIAKSIQQNIKKIKGIKHEI